MGTAASATIIPDPASPLKRPSHPARPRGLSLFSGGSSDESPSLSEWAGSTMPVRPPPMDEEVTDFLIGIFDKLFCTGKGFEANLQSSLLLDVVQYACFSEGSVLMTQGDIGQEMYIIENGDVEVLVNGDTVCHFRRGSVIGELALLYDSPRSATIRCLTNTSCYVLSRKHFKSIQEITAANTIAKRTEWMQAIPEFAALGNVGLYKIVHALEAVEMKKGDLLYQRGVASDRLYIIESGTAELRSAESTTDDEIEKLARNFSVQGTSIKADADAIEMVDDMLPQLKVSANFSRKFCSFQGRSESDPTSVKDFESPLQSSKIQSINADETANIEDDESNAVVPVSVWIATEAIRQQSFERAPSFCDVATVYASGSILGVSVLSTYSHNAKVPGRASDIDAGEWEWFRGSDSAGQLAGAVAPFCVSVTSETAVVLTLSLKTLDNIFGSFGVLWLELEHCAAKGVEYVLRKVTDDNDAINSNTAKLKRFDFSKFEQLCFIKDGSYGCSSLVRYYNEEDKSLNSVYYLLRKSKFKIAQHNLIQKNLDELSILNQLSSRFVAGIVGLSISPDEIAFVYKNQGVTDLWSYIYEYNGTERSVNISQIQCIVASLVLGLDHIHSLGIVFRELKPEHVSIDNFGSVRLSDFGSAKRIPFTKVLPNGKMKIQTKSFTLMGTPEYLAPEMVLNHGVDQAADVWALGIITYEMMMLSTPFADAEGTKVFSKIAAVMKKGFVSPQAFSKKCGNSGVQQLVEKLLRPQPAQRLSCAERKTANILRHPFFRAFDVEQLKKDDFSLPGYSDLHHQSAACTSASYKLYTPEVLPYTGDNAVWNVFENL